MDIQLAQAITTDSNGFILPPNQTPPAAAPPPAVSAEVAVPPPAPAPLPTESPVNPIVLVMLVVIVLLFFAVHIGVEVSRSKRYWSGPVWGTIAFFANLLLLPAGFVYLQWLGLDSDVIAGWGFGRWIAAILSISVICWITLQLVVKILPDDPPAGLQRQTRRE